MKIKDRFNSKYGHLIKNSFIFAIGNLGSKFIVFLLVPLYTNYLTSEQYGAADLVFTVSQLFIPIVSLVIFDAVMRFGITNREKPESTLVNGLIVWFAGAVLMLCILPVINMFPTIREWKWYLYFYVISNILLSVLLNYLKVKEKNLSYSIICIIQTFINAILNIWLIVYLHDGIRGYLLSNVAATVLACVIALFTGNIFKDIKNAVFDMSLMKSMLKYSAPLIFNNLAWWIIQSSDKIMIEYFVGFAALGLYTVATRIPSMISVVVSVFQQAWGISSSIEMDSSNDPDFYTKVYDVFSSQVFLACLLLNSFVKPFMSFYVGAEFTESWHMVPLLMVAAVYSAIAAYFGSMYGALKKSVNNMLTTVTAGIINIIVNYLCIIKIGALGAVVGTAVSYIVMATVRMADVLRFVPIKVSWRKFLLNSILIISHALFIMNGTHIIVLSFLIFVLFMIINRNLIKSLKK